MEYFKIEDNLGQGAYPVYVPTAYCSRQVSNTQPRSVREVLQEAFGEDFGLVIGNYVRMEEEKLREIDFFKRAKDFELKSWNYCKTESVLGQPIKQTVVDFLVEGVVSGKEYAGEKANTKTITIMFRIRYILDLRPCERCCLGPLIFIDYLWKDDPVFPTYTIKTDEYLIPNLYKKDYEFVGRAMLDSYFPENGNRIGYCRVDAEELAKRMQLTVKNVRFADNTVMGQIYYDFENVTLIDENGVRYSERIKPGTILINTKTCTNTAIRNSTIVHECCHMFLDRWFFLLQMMAGKAYAAYTSRTRTGMTRSFNSPLDWMEYQCDKLPAYILMAGDHTEAFIREQLDKEAQPNSIEASRRVINAVAMKYGVSRSMAKYRMIELGFPQADGVYCYVDGIHIPDHGTGNAWKQGITYNIDAAGAAKLMTESKRFAYLAASGEYLYINGHFCRNSDKYLGRTKAGVVYMNDYAKEHMDECCLAFNVSAGNRDGEYQFGFASRKKKTPDGKKYRVSYSLEAEAGTDLYVKENSEFAYGSFAWGDLLKRMPNDFKEAVLLVLEEVGVTQETLALELGVDKRVVYRLLNADRVAAGRVVGMCVALKLPYFVSHRLLELSGNALRNTEMDYLYSMFLFKAEKLTVERCNAILMENNLPPMYNGQQEN